MLPNDGERLLNCRSSGRGRAFLIKRKSRIRPKNRRYGPARDVDWAAKPLFPGMELREALMHSSFDFTWLSNELIERNLVWKWNPSAI